MKKIFTLLFLTVSLFATAQQNGAVEYMYIHRSNNVVDSIAVAEIDSVTFAVHGVPEIPDTPITPPAGTQYEAVDLGLSVKWASCNVGATTPEDCGDYYAWGETEVKDYYDWSTYKWCNGSEITMTKYCTDSNYGTVDNKTTLDPEDDVARVKWGGDWRMPTLAEQEELLNDCTWTWTTLNGVNGYCVTGPNGNTIFLPATGYYYDVETIYGKGNDGGFWSNTLAADYNSRAYEMSFYIKSYFHNYKTLRYYGMTVRPVCGEGVTPVFQYSVSVSSAGGGAVTIKDKDGTSAEVEEGATVTVVATPDEGYLFEGWFVDGSEASVSTDAEYTFTVSGDVALVARFKEGLSIETYILDTAAHPYYIGGMLHNSNDNIVKKGLIVSVKRDDLCYNNESECIPPYLEIHNDENRRDAMDFNLERKVIDCTNYGDIQFNVPLTFVLGNTLYYIRAFALDNNGTVYYGNVVEITTGNFNREIERHHNANVWYSFNGEYTLFDLATDESIDPVSDGYYYSTDQNYTNCQYNIGNGYNTCYKFKTEWNYRLWYSNKHEKENVASMPKMRYKDGKLHIDKQERDADKNIEIYYSINENGRCPETFTKKYDAPLEINEGDVVYCYAISEEGYITYTNIYKRFPATPPAETQY